MASKQETWPQLLDTMVDCLLRHDEIPFLDLVQDVWRRGLDIAAVPQPVDEAALRIALKACIIERLAEIWAAPPKNTPVSVPGWCAEVLPVQDHFSVIAPEFTAFFTDEEGCPTFAKRNIFAPNEFMFFL